MTMSSGQAVSRIDTICEKVFVNDGNLREFLPVSKEERDLLTEDSVGELRLRFPTMRLDRNGSFSTNQGG